MSKVIAIAQGKGGVAKTATAVNLGAFLGQKRSTLLVDMDPQGHVAECFALDSLVLSPNVYDAMFERNPVVEAIRPQRDKLALLPATRDLALGEVELRDTLRREERLRRTLAPVENDYEFVVIDTPPSLGLLTINALIAADVVLIPISTPIALTGTGHLLELMHELKSAFEKQWDIRVVQTFYRAGVRESEALRERLEEEFEGMLLGARINLNTQISMAMSAGRPILDYPDSSGYLDYARLTEEMLRVTGAQTENAGGTGARGRRRGRQADGN